jgi:hypothetical protein
MKKCNGSSVRGERVARVKVSGKFRRHTALLAGSMRRVQTFMRSRMVAPDNLVPSWSRDGRFIYFASKRTGSGQIWKHSVKDGSERQLAEHGGFDPLESYDGRTIYYSKFDEPGRGSIPAGGGSESPVVIGKPQVSYWGHWAVTERGLYLLDADAEPRPTIEFYSFATPRITPEEGEYPFEDHVTFTVTSARPATLTMNFRIPAWAQGASVSVNGTRQKALAVPGQFAAVRREWKTGDRVDLDLPLRMRLESIDDRHTDTVAHMRGALVLMAVKQ